MEDFRLKVLCSVARNRSLTKASHELYITQPVITKYIQEYEQEYGVMLFNRTNSGVELTEAGELMLSHAEKILRQYRNMDFDMRMLSQNHAGELRLGASNTISHYLLPSHMAAFTTKFKQIKLTLIEGSSEEIEQALDAGEIDLGLIEGNDHSSHLRYTPFLLDRLLLVASRDSRLAQLDKITPNQLQSLPLVVGKRLYDCSSMIETELKRHNFTLSQCNIMTRMDSTESVKHYLNGTDCAAILPAQSLLQELSAGILKVIEIENIVWEREYAFVRRMEETSALSKDFINFMQQGL